MQARFKVATRLNLTLKLANQPKYELAASFLCLLGILKFDKQKNRRHSSFEFNDLYIFKDTIRILIKAQTLTRNHI